MIVPMLKYTCIVHHADYPDFLEDIRNIGVLDIVDKQSGMSEELKNITRKFRSYHDILKFLNSRKEELTEKNTVADKSTVPEVADVEAIFDSVTQLRNDLDKLNQQIVSHSKEIRLLEPWGRFSKSLIDELKATGIHIRLFICPESKFSEEWTASHNIEIISEKDSQLYFALISGGDENIDDIKAEETAIPEHSVEDVIRNRERLILQKEELEIELDAYALHTTDQIAEYLNRFEEKIDFQNVTLNTDHAGDDKLRIITGYLPVTVKEKLDQYLAGESIVFISQKPAPEDKVPILLKNSKFSKLFEPIGNLFSLPAYAELDLTPFFAPFFMMFFGFCLGDAGYGLLFVIGATLYKLKAKPSIRPYLTLAQFLGIATIIFGVISGTFFGIDLIKTEVAFLDSFRGYFFDSEKMFYLALIVGGIQIVFGMFVKVFNIIRQNGISYSFSTIGWLILILGMIARYALIETGVLPVTDQIVLYSILAVSGIMILFLNDPKSNIFIRFGKGIWDVYGTVTGVFGDLLSYIRLFALGISSAILGLVINSIGMNMLEIPYIGPVIFVVFLTIGHVANILISSLGSFVHPMRLTFVEFYKNAGFAGGGKAYKPFAKKIKN